MSDSKGYKALVEAAATATTEQTLADGETNTKVMIGLADDGSHVRFFFERPVGTVVYVFDLDVPFIPSMARALLEHHAKGMKLQHDIATNVPIRKPPKGKIV